VKYNFVPCQPGQTNQVQRFNGNTHHTICLDGLEQINADLENLASMKNAYRGGN
jgi:hypothetical protein